MHFLGFRIHRGKLRLDGCRCASGRSSGASGRSQSGATGKACGNASPLRLFSRSFRLDELLRPVRSYTLLPTSTNGYAAACGRATGRCGVDPRNRIRRLLKLGIGKRSAILAGLSRKGYWRLAQHAQHSHRDDQRLARRARRHLAEGTMGQHSLPGRQSLQATPSSLVTA